jgi:hypothetical protein
MAGSLRRRFHLRSPDVVELLDLLDLDALQYAALGGELRAA